MSDGESSEQRRDRRIEAHVRVKVRFDDLERFRVFTTQDLSAGGLFIVTETPKPIGSVVQLVMYPPGLELGLPIYGEVARVVTPAEAADHGGRAGMGIHFEALDDEAHDSLLGLVETVLKAFADAPAAPPAAVTPALERSTVSPPPPSATSAVTPAAPAGGPPAASGGDLEEDEVVEELTETAEEGAEEVIAVDEADFASPAWTAPPLPTLAAPAPTRAGAPPPPSPPAPSTPASRRLDALGLDEDLAADDALFAAQEQAPPATGAPYTPFAPVGPPLAPIAPVGPPLARTAPSGPGPLPHGAHGALAALAAAGVAPPSAPASSAERRGAERVSSRNEVRLRFADAQHFREFNTRDVSRGGLFVCTPSPLPEGAEVSLVLSLPLGAELRLQGLVVRSQPQGPQTPVDAAGMAVQFTGLTPDKRAELNQQLEELLARRPGGEKLGRMRPVSAVQVRYESPLDFVKVVRGELRHRRLFVTTEDPRPVGTALQVLLQAPQLPEAATLAGEVERVVTREEADRQAIAPGMLLRLTELTDEYLADLDARVRPGPQQAAPPQPQVTIASGKAARLAEAAADDLKAGRRSSAIMNLKLALSFDPTNREYRRLHDELVTQGKSEPAVRGKGPEKK